MSALFHVIPGLSGIAAGARAIGRDCAALFVAVGSFCLGLLVVALTVGWVVRVRFTRWRPRNRRAATAE